MFLFTRLEEEQSRGSSEANADQSYLSAVGLEHNRLSFGLALGVGHGVFHLVRRFFIAPAEKEVKRSEKWSEKEKLHPLNLVLG